MFSCSPLEKDIFEELSPYSFAAQKSFHIAVGGQMHCPSLTLKSYNSAHKLIRQYRRLLYRRGLRREMRGPLLSNRDQISTDTPVLTFLHVLAQNPADVHLLYDSTPRRLAYSDVNKDALHTTAYN